MNKNAIYPIIMAVVSLASMAAQASCLDDVDALAKRYHVGTALPAASGNAEATSDKLAQSGGVIVPPPTGDLASATPSVPNSDNMQTAPAIMPQGAMSGGKTPAAPERDAASDTQAASLLQAARDASKTGNETTCQQHLTDAMKLLAKGSAGP